jgi:hypothetical protein
VHVCACRALLAVTALKEDDLLRDAGGNGGGEAALARGNAGEVAGVARAEGCHAAHGVPDHGAGHGLAVGGVGWAGTRRQAREDGRAGWALDPGARGAEGAAGDAQDVEPDPQLEHEVELRVGRAAHRRVVAAPLGVVLALHDVKRECAVVSGDAVGAVEVEQQVADTQGPQLADSEAADGGKASGKAIPIVRKGERSPGQESLHHGAVDGEDEGTGGPLQGAQDARP